MQEQQDAKMKTLQRIEEIEWRHAAESLIYLDFLNGATSLWIQQDESLKMTQDKLEEENWEHDLESSIYLEVLSGTALSYSEESSYLKEKLRKGVSILLNGV